MKNTASALMFALSLAFLPGAPLVAQSAERQLDSRAYIDVARNVLPGVVNISVEPRDMPRDESAPSTADYQDLMRWYEEQRGLGSFGTSSGSGVVVRVENDKGYVVTNNHVIDPLTERMQIRLTFHTLTPGTTDYSTTVELVGDTVRVLGKDKLSDLAVLEFDKPADMNVVAVEWGDSDKAEIGENVVALGNPLDLNHTVTTGIVSGKSRYLGKSISLEKLLQTNAVIQPGNSGGPLVNLDGKIIGINNAIASRNGLWQGTSFAIPSNDAKRISDSLIDRGRVSRGYLGVTMEDLMLLEPEALNAYGVKVSDGGVHIRTVVRNSPADIAGIHVNDLVLAIDDEPVRSSDEMLQIIARRNVDSSVNIKLIRLDEDKTPRTLNVTARLGERPDETIILDMHREENSSNETIPSIQVDPSVPPSRRDLGVELESWYDEATRESGMKVTTVAPRSPAQEAGLEAGDLILSINGRPVRSLGDFRAALAATQNSQAQIVVRRDGVEQLVVVKSP